MEIYLAAILAIIALNALPAFAPPTWMALVFFLLQYDLNPVALVILGVYAILALFLTSPVSSAQLFEAAGMMKTISLKPLLAAFAIGRTISYSTYVTGAAAIAATNFGELLIHELRSPWAIGVQVVMIAGLISLGSIDWHKKLKR